MNRIKIFLAFSIVFLIAVIFFPLEKRPIIQNFNLKENLEPTSSPTGTALQSALTQLLKQNPSLSDAREVLWNRLEKRFPKVEEELQSDPDDRILSQKMLKGTNGEKLVATIAVSRRYTQQDVEFEIDARAAFEAWAAEDPQAAFDNASELLRSFPPSGYDQEKSALLQAILKIPGYETQASRIALELLKLPLSFELAKQAYMGFLQNESNENSALTETVSAISNQSDSNAQRFMGDRFIEKFPNREISFKDALNKNQIVIY